MTKTLLLTPAEYQATIAKFATVNARAAKKGFTGRLTVEGTRVERTSTDALGFERTEVFIETSVGGEAPQYNGWTFLARVDRLEDTFTIAAAPGVDQVDRSLVRPGDCDHCGHDRRRNNTYLVRETSTGVTKNVGSTCIKDFLGWDASVVFISQDEAEREIEGAIGGYRESAYSIDYVLAVAWAATKSQGWVPSSSYDKIPTASWVRMILNPPTRLHPEERNILAEIGAYAQEATTKAATIREFILSDAFSGSSTYVDNLKASCSAEYITDKQVGLLASAPRAYTRHLETQAEREAQQARWDAEKSAKAGSDFLAPVGTKKVEVEGTISAIRYIEGDYGTTTLYTILSTDGNLVKWFSSAGSLGDDEGREVKIVGTVKAHDEYNGVKSTVLTRCKEVAA